MNDIHLKVLQVTTVFKKEIPQYKKIIFACQCLSGLDITNISQTTKDYLYDHLNKTNRIISQYPIHEWEDYQLISDMHQNKMLKSFENLCRILISDK